MSYMIAHLHNGWQVDQAILSEEDRVVVIRFGHDWDPTCMKMDEVLYSIAEKVRHNLLICLFLFLYFQAFLIKDYFLITSVKILLLFTWLISQKFQISIKCMNCMTHVQSCFSSEINTS